MQADGVAPLRDLMSRLDLSAEDLDAYRPTLLNRPAFADLHRLESAVQDVEQLLNLMADMPVRLFDGDVDRYLQSLGVEADERACILRGSAGRLLPYGRVDTVTDADGGYRILEVNATSNLFGIDSGHINRALLRDPEFEKFYREFDLDYVDTTTKVAELLTEVAPATPGAEPVIALVEGRGGVSANGPILAAIAASLELHGLRVVLGELNDLREVNGKLHLECHGPIDVLVRYFENDQLLAASPDLELLDMIMRADRRGTTTFFTSLDACLHDSKALLGLLHSHRGRAVMQDKERRLVDRLVPWTKLLGRDLKYVEEHERRKVLERCMDEQDDLVLKPGLAFGGRDVKFGSDVSKESWSQLIKYGASTDLVVQERADGLPEPVLNFDTGEVEDWRANWGLFITGRGFSGGYMRALQPIQGLVINHTNPATRSTCLFTTPRDTIDSPAAPPGRGVPRAWPPDVRPHGS